MLYAAVFELLFKQNNSKNVIINEYIKTAEFFLENAQIKYLNAILDKIAKILRKE
jgi:transcription termination factor NusB